MADSNTQQQTGGAGPSGLRQNEQNGGLRPQGQDGAQNPLSEVPGAQVGPGTAGQSAAEGAEAPGQVEPEPEPEWAAALRAPGRLTLKALSQALLGMYAQLNTTIAGVAVRAGGTGQGGGPGTPSTQPNALAQALGQAVPAPLAPTAQQQVAGQPGQAAAGGTVTENGVAAPPQQQVPPRQQAPASQGHAPMEGMDGAGAPGAGQLGQNGQQPMGTQQQRMLAQQQGGRPEIEPFAPPPFVLPQFGARGAGQLGQNDQQPLPQSEPIGLSVLLGTAASRALSALWQQARAWAWAALAWAATWQARALRVRVQRVLPPTGSLCSVTAPCGRKASPWMRLPLTTLMR